MSALALPSRARARLSFRPSVRDTRLGSTTGTLSLLSALITLLSLAPCASAHDGHNHSASLPQPSAVAQERDDQPSQLAIRRLQAVTEGRADPALIGQWSPVYNWPVLAVHANLLPTGQVMAWDATPDDFDDDPHTTDNYTTRVTIWNPLDNTHQETNNDTNADLFCAGSSQLWDGRVLFAGGDSGKQGRNGPLSNSSIYDPWTNTWTQADHLNAPRWYSSVAPLANGEILTFGGTYSPSPLAEVFQFNQQWRELPIETQYTFSGDYSWLQTTGDGDVMYLGPHNTLSTLNTAGAGDWTVGPERDDVPYRGYGSYAMFGKDQVLVSGGSNSVRSAIVVDMATQSSTTTGSMYFGRRQHNLTILADGSVLATGGNSSGAPLVDLNNPIMTPEIWDPTTGEWSVLANMQRIRQYHSVALLLPDGRVLSAGGGYCGDCSKVGYHEQNAEIYSPPYLFDAQGAPATRPQIRYAPPILSYQQPFGVITPDATSITHAHLVKLGSVTHSQNQEQRLIPLEFTASGGSLDIEGPDSREQAPPGHYMLFLVDDQGTPSEAAIVQVGHPLIQSDEVIVDTLRPFHWEYFEIQGDGSHSLTVSFQGNASNIGLYVSKGSPPRSPSAANGFSLCQADTDLANRKTCVVSANQTTTWYLGLLSSQVEPYSMLASISTDRPFISGVGSKPDAPTNLLANLKTFDHVELSWDTARSDENLIGYEIWRDNELVNFSEQASFVDKPLFAETLYKYQIASVNTLQQRSELSPPFYVRTSPNPNPDLDALYNPEVPTIPGKLRYERYSPGTIELFWERSVDNGVVMGYEIYRNGEVLTLVPGVSYLDSSLVPGEAYTYWVIAMDNEGYRSDSSSKVSVNLRSAAPEPEDSTTTATDAVDVDGENSALLTGNSSFSSGGSSGGFTSVWAVLLLATALCARVFRFQVRPFTKADKNRLHHASRYRPVQG